ncbi:PREDICTED: uncharacterized protein LOC105961524 [Erythranthe guttata]|uniref:uncharacterized protein LOC105961524 n=1 Tax=Erythranthe guttata TaxID=4155 RepID=UPI00064DF88C|nr:PREDICTED: uncharacterized protein LOC105961524 [Erythranthe guttata]|eukprot:XP_012841207.1 PREDICTED: uncharacterized protein LOC105961524 [Erythranthe guttata]
MFHREGASTVRPPLLDGSNYSYWKSKMKMFIKSVDERAWRAIVTGWTPPMAKGTDGMQTVKPEEAWTNEEILLANYNSRAINSIFSGVGDNQFKLIASCESAKRAWEILQVTYEGTSTVKTSKLQMLATRFESLHMEEDETIADFHAKLCDISNESYALGEQYSETKLVRKALRSLPERFAYRVAAIEEVRDINTLKLDGLMGNSVNPNKFKKFSNNGYSGDAKSRRLQCRECGGFGHIQAECANTLKKNKMSLTTVWSDKEDSDEDENNKEDQTTNFMAFSGTTSMSRTEGTVATVCPTDFRYDELSLNKDNSLTSPFNFAGESESSSDDEEPTLEEVKDVYEKMYRKWLEVSEVNKRLENDKHVLIEENKVLKKGGEKNSNDGMNTGGVLTTVATVHQTVDGQKYRTNNKHCAEKLFLLLHILLSRAYLNELSAFIWNYDVILNLLTLVHAGCEKAFSPFEGNLVPKTEVEPKVATKGPCRDMDHMPQQFQWPCSATCIQDRGMRMLQSVMPRHKHDVAALGSSRKI